MIPQEMQAIIITQPGDPSVLKMETRPVPVPKDHEVLIRIHAAGVNRPDVMQRKGIYPAPPDAPQDIPGLEVAGEILACGPKVTQWKVGDGVCALLQGGGYAEYAVTQEGQCLPIPLGLNYAEAAALPETVLTVWHNVFQLGQLKSREHFLVHGGSSGIGTTAIQIAKLTGAKVYATAGTEEKCEACMKLGADLCINYKTQDFEAELKKLGIDVILDMIGGPYIAKNIRLLREDGRLIFINTMKGAKPPVDDLPDFGLVMRKRLTITGSTLRNRDTAFKKRLTDEVYAEVWPLLESRLFKPILFKTFPLREANLAHQLMESSDHVGKIVLLND